MVPGSLDSQTIVPGTPTLVSGGGFPSIVITGLPGQTTPEGPPCPWPTGAGVVTRSASLTAIGTDGLPTIVETTWVVPVSDTLPTGTSWGLPSGFPGASITEAVSTEASAAAVETAVTTAVIIGPDGLPTSVLQTVVVPVTADLDSASGILQSSFPQGTATGLPTPGPWTPLPDGYPSLSAYGGDLSNTLLPGSFDTASAIAVSTADPASVSGTITGTLTSTLTIVTDPWGVPISSGVGDGPLPAYDESLGDVSSPDAGSVSTPSEITLWPPASKTPCTTTTLRTSTWTNLIREPTTSYAINFPLTTMATITVPAGKRMIRRQLGFVGFACGFLSY